MSKVRSCPIHCFDFSEVQLGLNKKKVTIPRDIGCRKGDVSMNLPEVDITREQLRRRIENYECQIHVSREV